MRLFVVAVMTAACLCGALTASAAGAKADSVLAALPDTFQVNQTWYVNGHQFVGPHVLSWDGGQLLLHGEIIWPDQVKDRPNITPTAMDERINALHQTAMRVSQETGRSQTAVRAVYDSSTVVEHTRIDESGVLKVKFWGDPYEEAINAVAPRPGTPAQTTPKDDAVCLVTLIQTAARFQRMVVIGPGYTEVIASLTKAHDQIAAAINTGNVQTSGPLSHSALSDIVAKNSGGGR